MKITASILDEIGHRAPYSDARPLRVTEAELDPPGPSELLVKIEAAGLCHSDLSVINGDRPRPMPMAIGHEAVATVIEPGTEAAAHFASGDRVVLSFLPLCGDCPACLAGEGYLCARGSAANGSGTLLCGERRLSESGAPVNHHMGASAFATHAVVDRHSATKIPGDIPVEIAALFGCAVLTGVGAVYNTAKLRPGESVAIYGLGGVGLAALIGAISAGGVPVVAVDPMEAKRALALELGASLAVAPDNAEAEIEQYLGAKPDVVIESVGKAAVLAKAYGLGRRGGRIVTVGLPNPAEVLSISALSLVGDGKTLMGSYMGSSIPSRDIPRYIALWRAGRLPVERLLTSVGKLEDINALFDRLASGEAVRQVVIP